MIAYKVYVDFDNDGSFATAGDDITAYVTSLQASLGMEDEQAHVATVGFCQVTLNNASKLFSPEYSSGTYYGKLLPRLPFKVDVVEGGNTYTLFRGVTSRWHAQSGEFWAARGHVEAECCCRCSNPPIWPCRCGGHHRRRAAQARRVGGLPDRAGRGLYRLRAATCPTTHRDGRERDVHLQDGADLAGGGRAKCDWRRRPPSPPENLIAAINGEEGAGTTYSTALSAQTWRRPAWTEYLEIKTAGVAQGFALAGLTMAICTMRASASRSIRAGC
jgi:hypothetical protein